jgi:hypothetical protein
MLVKQLFVITNVGNILIAGGNHRPSKLSLNDNPQPVCQTECLAVARIFGSNPEENPMSCTGAHTMAGIGNH